MSQKVQKTYVLGGETAELADVATGTAVKNAAKRFAAGYGLPDGAAFAFAAATVDPAEERSKLKAGDPIEHLNAIETPSGVKLLCHPARLWSIGVAGDGSNGRSRFELQVDRNGTGPSVRPWPLGRHHKPAIIDYHPSALEDMVAAVRRSAESIRSENLISEIKAHARGIWNPPVFVLARIFINTDGGEVVRWFLHSIEGSTRVEAAHELTGTDPGAPLLSSDDPLRHVRDARAQLDARFNELPSSEDSVAAHRAATIPGLVVVAAIGSNDERIEDGFPDVVNDYVESVHVQPRPFSDVAQSNVLGERFLLSLRRAGHMSENTVRSILGRDVVEGKPSVRAATLTQAVCTPRNEEALRDILAAQERTRLTVRRRSELVGPLVIRQFNESATSADRALMRPFIPDALVDRAWDLSGDSSSKLRKKARADLDSGKLDSAALLEIMARGGPALCAAGLLLSDQGSTVKDFSILRGQVSKVVEALGKMPGGVEVLADAIAWADGERAERPRQYKPDGSVRQTGTGDEMHYDPSWDKGNMQIRALAFNNGAVPRKKKTKPIQIDPVILSPEAKYKQLQDEMIEALSAARTHFMDLVSLRDKAGKRLIESEGLPKNDVLRIFPGQLSDTYTKWGQSDPLATLDEDLIPDARLDETEEDEEE